MKDKPSLAVMIGLPKRGAGGPAAREEEGEGASDADLGRAFLDAVKDDDAEGVVAAIRAISGD